jgi:hypothetical protein
MSNDFREQPKTNRLLKVISNYSNGSWILDVHDKIDIKNEKGIILESISINSMITRFYENKIVKPFGIISAYIWDNDKRKVEKYITGLPDNEHKKRMKDHQIKIIKEEQRKLHNELKLLTI